MKALVTGVTGQDGSYLAELLLDKGYEVHGLIRRSSRPLPDYLDKRVLLRYGDLSDSASLVEAVADLDEVYNLAAQSDVGASFHIPVATADTDALGTLRILEALRYHRSEARFYQAGTSEMFGDSEPPQYELTPFRPRSPYGVAKVFAHHAVVHYREAYGLHASNGILFNHESPRRGTQFVTRKVVQGAVAAAKDRHHKLYLGNLDARRDWGYAPEYVEAMWLMLQQPGPGDYVIATGESHSVRDLCATAFGLLGLDWAAYVYHDPRQERPADVPHLQGLPHKARRVLGWQPRTTFADLVRTMLLAEDGCPILRS